MKQNSGPIGFLKSELLKRCHNNPRYSQASFARDLGMSRGELSEILNGKRRLSFKNIFKIAEALGLSTYERQHLLESPDEKSNTSHSYHLEKLELLANPFTLAIFALTDLSNFRWDPEWIARKLGSRVFEVKLSLEKLVQNGLIRRKGRDFEVILDLLSSPDDRPSLATRELHKHYLESAIRALESQSLLERHFTGLSMALNLKDLADLKKEISSFFDHIDEKYSVKSKRKDALYHIEMAFFRLDKGDSHAA